MGRTSWFFLIFAEILVLSLSLLGLFDLWGGALWARLFFDVGHGGERVGARRLTSRGERGTLVGEGDQTKLDSLISDDTQGRTEMTV